MIKHKEMAGGRWFKFSLIEQLANIGLDIERTIQWRDRGNKEYSQQAFERALELIDLTKMDPKNRHRLSEICRTREALVDYFVYDNTYQTNDTIWKNYFYQYNYAAARMRGR